jgi:hypothetical protein
VGPRADRNDVERTYITTFGNSKQLATIATTTNTTTTATILLTFLFSQSIYSLYFYSLVTSSGVCVPLHFFLPFISLSLWLYSPLDLGRIFQVLNLLHRR